MSDDTLFRYCGTALHRMIKLRKETLKQKRVVESVQLTTSDYGETIRTIELQ